MATKYRELPKILKDSNEIKVGKKFYTTRAPFYGDTVEVIEINRGGYPTLKSTKGKLKALLNG
jgi:hypothetical protein